MLAREPNYRYLKIFLDGFFSIFEAGISDRFKSEYSVRSPIPAINTIIFFIL